MIHKMVKKMHDDLDYWIHLQMGEDIVTMPSMRPEYQPLVKQVKDKFIDIPQDDETVAKLVLLALKEEMKLPWYKQPTLRLLIKLRIQKTIGGIWQRLKVEKLRLKY